MVIAAYRPKPGKEAALLDLVHDNVPHLRRLGFPTDRPALAMRNRDGVILEVFEWRDGAIATAHDHPDILAMWQRYADFCDYVPLHSLPEAQDMFATFTPLDLPQAAS